MTAATARVGLLVALAMIGGTLSVSLVAEGATAKAAYSVNLTVSDDRPDVGEVVRISGRVSPNAAGRRVEVQGRAAGTGWVTMARPRLNKNSVYKYSVRFNRAGRVEIRVVKPASRKVGAGKSRPRTLHIGRDTAPVITTTSLPTGVVGAAYAGVVETADGRPGRFTIGAGSLPAGLRIDAQRGTITGTPTAPGTSTFTVVFRDPDGRADAQPLSITVVSAAS